MTLKINYLGAKNCVTGSCHLVQTKVGVNILVDCGKAYGYDPELSFDRFPIIPWDIDKVGKINLAADKHR